MRQVVYILSFAIGLTLSTAAAGAPADKALSQPPCAYILAGSAEENSNTYSDSFSATKTLDLTLSVLLPRTLTGEHRIELRLYTPTGSLYQTLAVPVAAPGANKAQGLQTRTLPGYPRAKKVVVPQPITYLGEQYYKVDVAFPVGGTLITSNGLYGRWQVTAHLDGADEACGAAASFTITE